ncbi:hypothetical protein, partial [Salmonella sp. s54395]|uniref:hypothetical protein n=1 Tax=Salmonella sp. s54395 TaxID=3159664 RepID=UPI00397F9821
GNPPMINNPEPVTWRMTGTSSQQKLSKTQKQRNQRSGMTRKRLMTQPMKNQKILINQSSSQILMQRSLKIGTMTWMENGNHQ